jgi:proteic killer suppression protein
MIRSFDDKETELIWDGERSARYPMTIQHIARRKLRMIHNAQSITDLRVPPGNHLEKLSGDLIGYHSIRINRQWRIIFQWINEEAFNVRIIDYH